MCVASFESRGTTSQEIDEAVAQFIADSDAEGLPSTEAIAELRWFITEMSSYLVGGTRKPDARRVDRICV